MEDNGNNQQKLFNTCSKVTPKFVCTSLKVKFYFIGIYDVYINKWYL